jgi:hypothetical protein
VSEREGAQRERGATTLGRSEGRGPGQREERAQSEQAGPGEPGSVGEEAARLAEAVRGWARSTFPGLTDHLATGAPECRYCPFCQLVAVLRGDRPEATERVAEAASAVADAVRAVADALARPAGAWSGSTDEAAGDADSGDADSGDADSGDRATGDRATGDRAAAGNGAPGGPARPAGRRVEPIDLT